MIDICLGGSDEFSGKINYELKNGIKYEVYRDFKKKNPEIYDINHNEISKNFNIDKKTGNMFFYEQTKMDRDMMISTVATTQQGVKLADAEQNILIQKIANLAETGEEEVFYKKAVDKLDKMLLNDIGTDKSQDRPINNARKNIDIYKNKLEEINEAKIFKYKIEEENNQLLSEIEKENNNKVIFEKIKDILNENSIENEKIKIKSKIIEENKNKIEKNEAEKANLIKKKNKKNNILLFILIILINICSFIFIKNLIVNVALCSLIPIFIIYYIINNKKNSYTYLETQNIVLEKNNNELQNDVKTMEENLIKENAVKKQRLIENYGDIAKDLFNSNIDVAIKNNLEKINMLNLKLHKLELDRQNIEPKLEELAKTEELLKIEEGRLEKLQNESSEYAMTKQLLADAYQEMKSNVTPKFNQRLSSNISKISNQSYKNISLNDKLLVELNNGKYVSVENLSIGTIEQIYLSLRLSVTEELSEEPLPILLDEAFAYYDIERLKSTLSFLCNINHQVIIFTCTNREKNVLDQLNQEYTFIEL